MLVMAALGGAGTLFGPLIGALILVPLEELSNSYLGGRARASLSWSMAPSSSSSRASCRAVSFAVPAKPAPRPGADPVSGQLLEARNIVKAFGAFKAVNDASVDVGEGEIVGLIGPNGAGKSTFFNCLTGDLPPTSGTVTFGGVDVTQRPPEAQARLGLARTFQVPLDLRNPCRCSTTSRSARFLRHPRPPMRGPRRATCSRCGLARLADTPARSLGTPGRKRLEIARALATEPKALLLDEAMAGLTPDRGPDGDRPRAPHPRRPASPS